MADPQLPREMKAQLLEAYNKPYVLRSVPLPTITDPKDVLVRISAASYCHTDYVLAKGEMKPNPPSMPHIGSHESAGMVVAVGADVGDLKVGDRVGIPGRAYHPCGKCAECTAPSDDAPGYSVYCPHAKNVGISTNGGFAQYALADSRQIAPMPRELTAVETAPLMCAGLTIYAALKKCNLRIGQSVGIMGAGGGLGHLGLQFATKMGLNVMGIDAADLPLKLANDLSTEATIIDARATEPTEALYIFEQDHPKLEKPKSARKGLDATVILPESQKAFEYGMQLLRDHGTCMVIAFPEAGFHVSARDLVFRDIRIVGSLVGSNTTLREMLQFCAAHGVRAKVETFPLSELNDLVAAYHEGKGGKLVIDMGTEQD